MTIIAEIGQNHCGDLSLARYLIKEAKDNGADLVKFQLYQHDLLYKDTDIPNVELTFEQAKSYFDYGKEIGIEVFFSVFDVERIRWCEDIGVKRYKIAYSQRDNTGLQLSVRATKKPWIMSTDVSWDKSVIRELSTLYCVPNYPANITSLNFPDFDNYYWQGYSDHTIGLDAAKIALARGAQIIEKHFCIDHLTGVDAPWSMTPCELKELKRWHDICKEVL